MSGKNLVPNVPNLRLDAASSHRAKTTFSEAWTLLSLAWLGQNFLQSAPPYAACRYYYYYYYYYCYYCYYYYYYCCYYYYYCYYCYYYYYYYWYYYYCYYY